MQRIDGRVPPSPIVRARHRSEPPRLEDVERPVCQRAPLGTRSRKQTPPRPPPNPGPSRAVGSMPRAWQGRRPAREHDHDMRRRRSRHANALYKGHVRRTLLFSCFLTGSSASRERAAPLRLPLSTVRGSGFPSTSERLRLGTLLHVGEAVPRWRRSCVLKRLTSVPG